MKRIHRSNTNQHPPSLHASTTISSSFADEKAPNEKRPRPLRRYQPRGNRIRSLVLKCFILLLISLSLLVYLIALLYKDWPPDGRQLTPLGRIDQFQGEWWVSPNLTRAERFMLVVAHPDDECLFFSPTLLNLLTPRYVNRTELNATLVTNSSVNHTSPSFVESTALSSHPINSSLLHAPIGHVLSLSSGNAEGLGLKRTREMRASCWAFGIPSTKCIVLDHPELPDSMSVWWPEKKIAEFVKVYVDLWKIDMIVTFDHQGVSGHPNHRAISAAISRLVHTDPKFPMTFMLKSTSLLSKYTSLLSLPYSLYRHHQNRKSLLPQFSRPLSHPSQDKRRLADLVERTLLSLNIPIDRPSLNASSLLDHRHPRLLLRPDASPGMIEQPPLMNMSVDTVPRPTNDRLSSHHSFFLSSPRQYFEGRRAFNQHVSQAIWFRRLWLVFSRYMWINELVRLVPLEDRFEDAKPAVEASSVKPVFAEQQVGQKRLLDEELGQPIAGVPVESHQGP